MRLFADIVLFMALAMGLGIGIGFLSWRWRRHTVSRDEWDQQRRQLDAQAARLNELGARLRVLADASHQNGEDARRRREMVQNLRLERDGLVSALELAKHDAMEARYQAEQLSAQLGAVQRRLAELSINQARARLSGVRRGEQPIGVPPAPEGAQRIELPGSPTSPAQRGSGEEPPMFAERMHRPADGAGTEADPGRYEGQGDQRLPGVAG